MIILAIPTAVLLTLILTAAVTAYIFGRISYHCGFLAGQTGERFEYLTYVQEQHGELQADMETLRGHSASLLRPDATTSPARPSLTLPPPAPILPIPRPAAKAPPKPAAAATAGEDPPTRQA